MSRLLFENSKFAIGFAGVTLFGAAVFAAMSDSYSDDDETAIAASDEIDESDENPAPSTQTQPPPQAVGFADDEMLIEDAEGFSPEPSEVAELGDADDFNTGADSFDSGSNPSPAIGTSEARSDNSYSRSSSPTQPSSRGAGAGDSGGGLRPTNQPSRNIPTPEK